MLHRLVGEVTHQHDRIIIGVVLSLLIAAGGALVAHWSGLV